MSEIHVHALPMKADVLQLVGLTILAVLYFLDRRQWRRLLEAEKQLSYEQGKLAGIKWCTEEVRNSR